MNEELEPTIEEVEGEDSTLEAVEEATPAEETVA